MSHRSSSLTIQVSQLLLSPHAIHFINDGTLYTANPQFSPSSIHVCSTPSSIHSIASTKTQTLALTTSGTLYLTPSPSNRSKSSSSSFTSFSFLFHSFIHPSSKLSLPNSLLFSHIAAGDSHFAAVSQTGSLYLWGLNTAGQIPFDPRSSIELPTSSGIADVRCVACRGDHTCVGLADGVLFWPAFQPSRKETPKRSAKPIPVNLLYHLQIKPRQVACHDGFDTILAGDGSLWGFYYYATEQCVRSAAARGLFPDSVDPGCIYPLLPSIVQSSK